MKKFLLILILLSLPVLAQETPQEDRLDEPPPETLEELDQRKYLVVPGVLFLEEYQALDILRARGFARLRRVPIPTETRSGVVLYVVPPAGEKALPEDRLTVFISQQRKKPEQTQVEKEKRETPPVVTKTGVLGLPYWMMFQFLLLYFWVGGARKVDRDRVLGDILFIRLGAHQPQEKTPEQGKR